MKRKKTVKKNKTTPMTADEREYVEQRMEREAKSTLPPLKPEAILEYLVDGVQRHTNDPGARAAVVEWFTSTPGIGQIISMIDGNTRIGDHSVAMGYGAALLQMCLAAVIPGIFSNELVPTRVTASGGDA